MFEKKLAVCKINNTSYKGRNKVFDITPCAMKLLEQENEIKYGYIIINKHGNKIITLNYSG